MLDLVKAVPRYARDTFMPRKIFSCLLSATIPALVFFTISFYILRVQGFDTMQILRDPAQQSGASSFLGFLSNIGIWIWVSAAAISCYGALTLEAPRVFRHRELLILLASFSTILAIDDFFMIHDRYVNQLLCYALYVIVAGLLFLRHHESIVRIQGFAFMLGIGFLGASIANDTFQGHLQYYLTVDYDVTQIFEEGFKFLGAATWLYFAYAAASFKGPATAE
ncbi:MAG: hypothetical protein WBD34_13125 [Burkholderiaceae bacterium]